MDSTIRTQYLKKAIWTSISNDHGDRLHFIEQVKKTPQEFDAINSP